MENIDVDIVHSIELAVAPVFLIAGIGALLTVLTNRLGRTVDRSRALEQELMVEGAMESHPRWRSEIILLDRRISWINRAIVLSTAAMLLICLVIVTLFAGQLFRLDVGILVSVLFIMTMGALISATGSFLWEIHLAAAMIRVRTDVLQRAQPVGRPKVRFWKRWK